MYSRGSISISRCISTWVIYQYRCVFFRMITSKIIRTAVIIASSYNFRFRSFLCLMQGSHASWKILESLGFFLLKFPGPGKSWENILKIRHLFVG